MKRAEEIQKMLKYTKKALRLRANQVKSSISARNGAECDGYRPKRTSLRPFGGEQKIENKAYRKLSMRDA